MKVTGRLFLMLLAILLVITACDTGTGGDGNTGNPKPPGPPGPPGPSKKGPAVTGLESSVLLYKDGIRLSWDRVEGAEHYRLYRYSLKSDPNPAVVELKSNSYSDSAIPEGELEQGVAYFYRVSSVKSGIESHLSSFSAGLFGENVDSYEISGSHNSNDHYQNITGQTASTLFKADSPPLIYSIPDGTGGVVTDSDWYKYRGEPRLLSINVKLQSGTGLKNGKLKIKFLYNGSFTEPETIKDGIIPGNYLFNSYGKNPPATVDVYYCIYIDEGLIDLDKKIIESYTVSEGL